MEKIIRENAFEQGKVLSRGSSDNKICGQAPPERGTFFRLQAHQRVGNSEVELYERVK